MTASDRGGEGRGGASHSSRRNKTCTRMFEIIEISKLDVLGRYLNLVFMTPLMIDKSYTTRRNL